MHAVVSQQAAYQAGLVGDTSTGPSGEYAADTVNENGYSDTPNAQWASPAFRLDETPGAPIEFRPTGEHPPYEHYRQRDEDERARHSVETLDADGFEVEVRIRPGEKRWTDDPRSTPAALSRPTQRMSPSTWRFLRPFDQTGARQLNGSHFSMADHRRDYEIGGMAPVASRRNTYRLSPAPWDTENIDMPPNQEPDVPAAKIIAVELPPSANRAWRL